MKYYKIPIHRDTFLYIMPAPFEPDLTHCNAYQLKALQVDLVVSLLSLNEVLDLNLSHEEASYKAIGINFVHFPISDFDVPKSEDAFIALAEEVSGLVAEGYIVAIHCRAGIGRSSLLAAAILVHKGFKASEVFEHLSENRQIKVPDKKSQAEWLLKISPRLINKI